MGEIELIKSPWAVSDAVDLGGESSPVSDASCDGIIGSRLLKYYSAVMDIPTSTLLLLDPIRQETDLQGDWAVIEDRCNGMRIPLDDRAKRITVKGSKLSMIKDGDKTAKDYHVALQRNATPKAMDWIDDDGKTITASYDIADGVWTLSLPDPRDKVMARPNKLTSDQGDTFTTYKLAKAKPMRLTPQSN